MESDSLQPSAPDQALADGGVSRDLPAGERRKKKRRPGPPAARELVLLRAPRAWPIAVMVVAALLGGSTERWTQGIVLALLGVTFLLRPLRRMAPTGELVVLGAWLALMLTAFLPVSWFGPILWRQQVGAMGVELPSTLSAQPWLSLDAVVLFLGGAAWLCWLSSQPWTSADRRWLVRALALGITALALGALWVWGSGETFFLWTSSSGLGPFPNRNQSGNLFALGGLLSLAALSQSWQRDQRSTPLWGLCVLVLLSALIVNGSRGGIVLFFGGAAVWCLWSAWFSRSWRAAAGALGGGGILLALFFVFGVRLLARFHLESAGGWLGARAAIFHDTFALIAAQPWAGLGAGNFRAVFALFRSSSVSQSVPIHPESDWLWVVAELGWGSVILALAALAVVLWRVFPMAPGSDRRLRAAALVGALGFALHGLVDVSGHRLGTMLPALFLLSLSAVRKAGKTEGAPWIALLSRGVGLGLLGVGFGWFYASVDHRPWPGAIGVASARHLAPLEIAENNFTEAKATIDEALPWAPLDWTLHFTRAVTRAHLGQWTLALGDFRRARRLQPFMAEVGMAEGRVWLGVRPELALPAWQEVLDAPFGETVAASFFGRMLQVAPQDSKFQNRLAELGQDRPLLELTLLLAGAADEPGAVLDKILSQDPLLDGFDREQKERFFAAWVLHGDVGKFERALELHPQWMESGWRSLAKVRIARDQAREAVTLALAHLPALPLPKASAYSPAAVLDRRTRTHPDDMANLYALAVVQYEAGQKPEALNTLRRTDTLAGCPPPSALLQSHPGRCRGAMGRGVGRSQARRHGGLRGGTR